MRGVPIIGRGSSSTMPGTNPLQALIAKENREEHAKRRRAAKRRKK